MSNFFTIINGVPNDLNILFEPISSGSIQNTGCFHNINGTFYDLGALFYPLSGAGSNAVKQYTTNTIGKNGYDLNNIFAKKGGVSYNTITISGTSNIDYKLTSYGSYSILYMYYSDTSLQGNITFTPSTTFTGDVLIVGGAGGGGYYATGTINSSACGGGGGGGGVGIGKLSFTKGTTYSCLVGSGGSAATLTSNGGDGNSSTIHDATNIINESATGGHGGTNGISNSYNIGFGGYGGDSGTGSSSSTGSFQLSYNQVGNAYSPDISYSYGGYLDLHHLYSKGGAGGGSGGNASFNSTNYSGIGGQGTLWIIDQCIYGAGGNGGLYVPHTYVFPSPTPNSGNGSEGGCRDEYRKTGGTVNYYSPQNGSNGIIAIASTEFCFTIG